MTANSLPFIAARTGNVPGTVLALGVAGVYDLGYVLHNREVCVQAVYGPGYF